MLAAVRSATAGMPVAEAAAAPFADGPWLFSHNGVVARLAGVAGRARRARCRPTDLLTLDAPTDSALLWALVRAPAAGRRDARPRRSPTSVAAVAAAAPGSRLNLLLTDGTTIVATACGARAVGALADATACVLVASEPLRRRPRLARRSPTGTCSSPPTAPRTAARWPTRSDRRCRRNRIRDARTLDVHLDAGRRSRRRCAPTCRAG